MRIIRLRGDEAMMMGKYTLKVSPEDFKLPFNGGVLMRELSIFSGENEALT